MIKVTSVTDKSNGVDNYCKSHVILQGDVSVLKCEIKSLINAFVNNPELENIYLTIATEIAQSHLEDLERTLEDLKND